MLRWLILSVLILLTSFTLSAQVTIVHSDYLGNGEVLTVLPDDTIVYFNGSNTLSFWELQAQEPVHEVTFEATLNVKLAWSPDEELIAVPTLDGAYVLSIETGQILHHLTSPVIEPVAEILEDTNLDGVSAVAFSPDGRYLATGSQNDSAVVLWNVETGEQEKILRRNSSPDDHHITRDLVFSPDGNTLASNDFFFANTALWNIQTGQLITTLVGTETIAFSPDSSQIAFAGGLFTGRGEVLNIVTLETTYQFSIPLVPIKIVWLDNERFLVQGTSGRLVQDGFVYHGSAVHSINTTTNEHLTFAETVEQQFAAELQPGEDFLYIGDPISSYRFAFINRETSDIRIQEEETGDNFQTFSVTSEEIRDFAINPNGALLATMGDGGTVSIWNLRDGSRFLTFRRLNATPYDASGKLYWVNNGTQLLTASRDGDVYLWDTSHLPQ